MVSGGYYQDDGNGAYWKGTPEEEAAYLLKIRTASIPQIISMRQCEKYLYSLDEGVTLQDVNALVPQLGPLAEIEWRRSAEVWRSSPLVELMRVQFGWTVEQMDQMFIDADKL